MYLPFIKIFKYQIVQRQTTSEKVANVSNVVQQMEQEKWEEKMVRTLNVFTTPFVQWPF